MEDFYCKIYIFASLSRQSLLELLTEITHGNLSAGTVETPWGLLDVLRNGEADLSKVSNSDGFLFYPYFMDVEGASHVTKSEFSEAIGEVLEALWAKNIKAVASCDFEEELPRKGGSEG
ncbi:hypothetical protein BH09VER1_BH09VER1_03490 [soil metagenome]